MSNLKMVFAIMAIVFIGIIALPYAVSVFAGQHAWYDISGSSDYLPCKKCHADVYEELDSSAFHKKLDDNPSSADDGDCYACHRANESITYASGKGSSATPSKEAHAASVIHCGYCHFNSSNPTRAPIAGGFGLSDYAVNPGNDTGAKASHYTFVTQSRDANILQNESESCVACHATTNVTIYFNVTTEATIIANNTYNSDSYWDIEDIAASNYTTYKGVKEG